MPIKMAKELPTEVGSYYWCTEEKEVEIVEVEMSMISTLYVDRGESGIWHIDELGGYWAKVDKDQFEFVD